VEKSALFTINEVATAVRITGGHARGIQIRAPRGKRTRPTSDKVREALFGILGERVSGATVLDLFAGSGALAIEALSRGAKHAVLVEKESAAAASARHNLKKTGLVEKARILQCDFRSGLARLDREKERFDIIFLDPPYHRDDIIDIVADALAKHPVTSDGCIIVVEHFEKISAPERIADVALDHTRSYGQTSLSFYF
jgi:16S rRNA (guanine(966)-N(2))-methyltransferase RsmD